MAHPSFSQDWLRFSDPYAVLGVSLAADDRRILKRYRQVAKLLHPDVQASQETGINEFAGQVLARLVNPAYQRLKSDKGRNEVLATLRFKVRRLAREDALKATCEAAQKLLQLPEPEIEIYYEQALLDLSTSQYDSSETFETLTRQISELNLVYLRRKMGDPVIREKRSGLVAASSVNTTAVAPTAPANDSASPNYAERHSRRAQEYLKNRNFSAAIQELKDAVKIDPQNSSYHCLLGQAYLLSQLSGMAKVHFKQALKLNPKNEVALKYARQLQIDDSQFSRPTSAAQPPKNEKRWRLFGGLFSKR
ncbi:MAG: DnaJ domain-containing protein [Cyanobacteria bacterium Co-bin8]|nr:DnaJ domain-containing protein [Cyanobacteria bacterium Co-bin8]